MKLQTVGLCALTLALAACGSSAEETNPTDETAAAPAPVEEEPSLADLATSAEGPFAPEDQCTGLYGFDSFRGQLRRTVTFRDAKGLAALADPAIKLDFGGTSGVEALTSKVEADPELWDDMADVLALGCASESETSATMPAFFATMPKDVDGTSAYLVTANDAPVYTDAEGTTPGDATISWDLVKLVGDAPAEGAEFAEVATLDGKTTGYMKLSQLRSAIDYRILANRGDDGWKIAAFVAGD